MSYPDSILDKSILKSRLRESFSAVVHDISVLSDEQFVTPLAKDKWNSGQHLAHLYLSTKATTKALSIPPSVLISKFGSLDRKEYSYRELFSVYKTRLTQEQIKAPDNFTVDVIQIEDREKYTNLFNTELHSLIKEIDTWNEEELSKCVIPHPALGAISQREMIMFTDFHTRHHGKAIASTQVILS